MYFPVRDLLLTGWVLGQEELVWDWFYSIGVFCVGLVDNPFLSVIYKL